MNEMTTLDSAQERWLRQSPGMPKGAGKPVFWLGVMLIVPGLVWSVLLGAEAFGAVLPA
ncbi:hypothetical protein [Altericroceibacterium spongiae]|uniref:hypothetical protein n=1 Tax=Altericroceibacterium spongiae TaxID=2320269 RepID=UPI001602AA58|nr:hypothetical protein [Altericroceibacterium spongiae]